MIVDLIQCFAAGLFGGWISMCLFDWAFPNYNLNQAMASNKQLTALIDKNIAHMTKQQALIEELSMTTITGIIEAANRGDFDDINTPNEKES